MQRVAFALLTPYFSFSAARADLLVLKDGTQVACRVTGETGTSLQIVTGSAARRMESTVSVEDIAGRLQAVDELDAIEICTDAGILSAWAASYYRAGYEMLSRRCIRRALSIAPELRDAPLRAADTPKEKSKDKSVGKKENAPSPDKAGDKSPEKKTDTSAGKSEVGMDAAPAADFARFWNFVIIRELTSNAGEDPRKLLAIARYARKGGHLAESAQILRRAWSLSPLTKEISHAAQEWGVHLEGWFGIDLSPALGESLFADMIVDEGIAVQAEPDREFFVLPVRYSTDEPRDAGPASMSFDRDVEDAGREPPAERIEGPAAPTRSLGRTALRGQAVRAFYGLRPIVAKDGDVRLSGLDDQPIYERASFSREERGGMTIELRNTLAPRTAMAVGDGPARKGPPPRTTRPRTPPVIDRATGRAALWFEIAKDQKAFRITWSDGGEESLDLDFVKQARFNNYGEIRNSAPQDSEEDRAAGKKRGCRWAAAPVIAETLRQVDSPSASMAALAISRLHVIRRELGWRDDEEGEDDRQSWSESADLAVLRAALRDEEQVRVAAWRYFCDYPDRREMLPSKLAVRTLAKAETDLVGAWVRIMACGLGHEYGGHWWKGITGHEGARGAQGGLGDGSAPSTPDSGSGESGNELPPEPTQAEKSAARLLEGILRNDDPIICSEAADMLTLLPAGVTNWQFLRNASGPAQRESLARIWRIRDARSSALLMQALILSARPEIAQDLVREAVSRGLHAREADAALLAQWSAFETTKRRVAFLNVLTGLHLGDHVYTPRFSKMIQEALDAGGLQRLAAWRLAAAQLRHRRENISIGLLKRTERLRTAADAEMESATITHRPAPKPPPSKASSALRASRSVVSPNEHGGVGRHYHGPYPLMIDPSSHDPLVRWTVGAAVNGSDELRRDALAALLDVGYADEAATALMNATFSHEKRRSILAALLQDAEIAYRDAAAALLAALLGPETADLAEMSLAHLDRVVERAHPEAGWRIRAAIKAGAHLERMENMARTLPRETARAARRWLYLLGHFTPQDRQRLESARTAREVEDRLAQINLRRGRLVDGRYGVLAIVAICPRRDVAQHERLSGRPPKWSPPQRVTIEMPTLELRSSSRAGSAQNSKDTGESASGGAGPAGDGVRSDDEYLVLWGEKVIGRGYAMEQPLPVRGPRAYFPTLRTTPGWWNLAGFLPAEGDEPQQGEAIAPGVPLRLPSQSVLWSPSPGTMTLEVSEYLSEGLRSVKTFAEHDLDEVVPSPLSISMRYRSFGCYSGCGPDILPGFFPPNEVGLSLVREEKAEIHLLNVMFVLERLEDDELPSK